MDTTSGGFVAAATSENSEKQSHASWPQAPQTLLPSAEIPDSTRAGTSMLTVIVPDLEASCAALRSRQPLLGPIDGWRLRADHCSRRQSHHPRPAWSGAKKVCTSLFLRVARTTLRAFVLIRVLQ